MDFFVTPNDYADNKNSYIQVCKHEIFIYDPDGNLKLTYRGFNFKNVVQVAERFLYATTDASTDPIVTRIDASTGDEEEIRISQKEGLYVFNVKALFAGVVERYKISSYGTGGCSSLIEYNENKGRIAYMEDYNTIIVMSLP